MRTMVVVGAALLSFSCITGCEPTSKGPPPPGADGCKATGGVCKVAVSVAAGSCANGSCVTLTPDSVHVGDGTGKVKDVNLLWTLQAPDYAFCEGDGVVFKGETQGQFSDNYATNDPDGKPDTATGGKRAYHWKDANSVKGGPYKYTVRFHDAKCATAYEKDPDVVNEM